MSAPTLSTDERITLRTTFAQDFEPHELDPLGFGLIRYLETYGHTGCT